MCEIMDYIYSQMRKKISMFTVDKISRISEISEISEILYSIYLEESEGIKL